MAVTHIDYDFPYEYHNIEDNFLTQLSDSIPVEWENNVSLIMADVNLKENLDIWFKGTSRKKAIVNGVPTPFSLLQRTVNYLQDKNVPLPKLVQNKNRKFICLNGAAKPHRARLVGDLYNKGYQNDGWISWVNRYGKLNHKKHFLRRVMNPIRNLVWVMIIPRVVITRLAHQYLARHLSC